ncbi:MAG: HlyD family efflux transporter periplasmic adaptor subunit, partial [Chlorobi bacterium]|nr:HlyD family efflux transporter periplasmic adaptor subunit [Chlorobiota bacterium]
MKQTRIILFSFILLFTISCNNQTETTGEIGNPKVQVKTTTVTYGNLHDFIEISGKTVYLNKNTIVAPISGYVTKVFVQQGDKVSKGTTLFEMQSSEAYVMRQNDSLSKSFGFVKIKAPENGIITNLQVVQNNIFLDQAFEMCVIIASGNLKVQANVPFEYRKYATPGQTGNVQLPDGNSIKITFSKVLPQMNEQTQTVKILANLNTNIFIPENMIVKILLEKRTKQKAQILPKNCVMADALMTKFWVMKLINDSVAVNT